jgi:hypothetical protein
MRTTLVLAIVLAALANPAQAQTTGIPFFNDYTINALGSGSTSCTSITFLTPVTLNFQVSGPPFTPVIIYISPLPCVGLPPAGPTCQGTSLNLAVPPLPWPMTTGVTDAAGFFNYVLPLPPVSPPLTLGTQSLLLCIPSFLPLFTQAYTVTLT